MSVPASEQTVLVVDDDPAVRKALTRLLRAHGWLVEAFASPQEFLDRRGDAPACVVLDVSLPGLDGLELQRRIAEQGARLPIVFLTGHGDIPMSVRAIKAGAVDFLTKPVHADALLSAIRAATEQAAAEARTRADDAELRERYEGLTPREREVFAGLAAGKLNKQVAWDLGIVEQTVKFHRAHIMERMRAKSAAELMLIAAKLSLG